MTYLVAVIEIEGEVVNVKFLIFLEGCIIWCSVFLEAVLLLQLFSSSILTLLAAVCFLSLLHKQDLLKHMVIKVDTKHYCQPKFE